MQILTKKNWFSLISFVMLGCFYLLTQKIIRMKTKTSSGRVKCVANFETLSTSVTSYGSAYNPSRDALKISALTPQLAAGKTVLGTLNTADAAWHLAVDARLDAFKPLSKLASRVLSAIQSTETTTLVDETAAALVHKLQGRRATPKMTAGEKQAAEADGKVIVEKSSSQLGFDLRVNTLDELIKLLGSVTQYAPNENDLKLAALTVLLTDLKAKNTAVKTAVVALQTARIACDEVLIKPCTGICPIGKDVKAYVKSVFGIHSPQYKNISRLKF